MNKEYEKNLIKKMRLLNSETGIELTLGLISQGYESNVQNLFLSVYGGEFLTINLIDYLKKKYKLEIIK
jgi:hypothetical protein